MLSGMMSGVMRKATQGCSYKKSVSLNLLSDEVPPFSHIFVAVALLCSRA